VRYKTNKKSIELPLNGNYAFKMGWITKNNGRGK